MQLGFMIIESGHHNHRNVPGGRIGLEVRDGFETIHARHHDVQQDEVRLISRGLDKRLGPTGCRNGFVPLHLEKCFQELDIAIFVIHHEDGGRARVG